MSVPAFPSTESGSRQHAGMWQRHAPLLPQLLLDWIIQRAFIQVRRSLVLVAFLKDLLFLQAQLMNEKMVWVGKYLLCIRSVCMPRISSSPHELTWVPGNAMLHSVAHE